MCKTIWFCTPFLYVHPPPLEFILDSVIDQERSKGIWSVVQLEIPPLHTMHKMVHKSAIPTNWLEKDVNNEFF